MKFRIPQSTCLLLFSLPLLLLACSKEEEEASLPCAEYKMRSALADGNVESAYLYDAACRLEKIEYYSGGELTGFTEFFFQNDRAVRAENNSRLSGDNYALSGAYSFAYHPAGQLAEVQFESNGTIVQTLAFQYDGGGQLIAIQNDGAAWQATTEGGNILELSQEAGGAGSLEEVTYSDVENPFRGLDPTGSASVIRYFSARLPASRVRYRTVGGQKEAMVQRSSYVYEVNDRNVPTREVETLELFEAAGDPQVFIYETRYSYR